MNEWHKGYRAGRLQVLRTNALESWREYTSFVKTLRNIGELPSTETTTVGALGAVSPESVEQAPAGATSPSSESSEPELVLRCDEYLPSDRVDYRCKLPLGHDGDHKFLEDETTFAP